VLRCSQCQTQLHGEIQKLCGRCLAFLCEHCQCPCSRLRMHVSTLPDSP
jgi:hypothetical protein